MGSNSDLRLGSEVHLRRERADNNRDTDSNNLGRAGTFLVSFE
jgi:hypothetical protein